MIWGTVNGDLEAVVRLRVRGPHGAEMEVAAVLDTGFSGMLTIPAELATALGASARSEIRATLADGSAMRLPLLPVEVWWAGRWRPILATGVGTDVLAGMRLLANCEVRIQVVPGGAVEVFPLPDEPI